MKNQSAFTLIELLVVVAVIGLLSAVTLVSLNGARQKAGISDAVRRVREVFTVVAIYYDDTGRYPQTCDSSCTVWSDPFINSLGVPGWRGPYATSIYNKEHYWGGQFGWENGDVDGDGLADHVIRLNDDSSGGGSNDGLIPVSAMTSIDTMLDDGNLNTGSFRGNGSGFGDNVHFGAAPGELVGKFAH